MRRTSQTERNKLGDPYRLFHEIQNVGKTYEGSKKKVRWVFGFTDSNEEFEVTLSHSMLSGKRTIKENGREIVSSSNMMATDFTYGWDSPSTHRLLRIEAQSNITEENDYIFTIDGIRFDDLPPKPVGGARKSTTETNSRYGSEVNTLKRPSANEHVANTNNQSLRSSVSNQRNQFQSPAVGKSKSSDDFDPFADNVPRKTESFDPFGNNGTTATPKSNSGGFDPFANPPQSNDSQTRTKPVQNKSAAKSVFDTVEDKTPNKTTQFDVFADNDPFSNPPAPSNTSNNDFDPFGESGTKKSTPTKGLTPPPPQKNNTVHRPAVQAPDFFSLPNDPAPSQPGRRASAVEISRDFDGLSFETKPAVQEQPQPVQQPRDAPKPVEEPKTEDAVDPWASNLIDLDLSGKSTAQRRTSLQANGGLSLNQMMGNPNQRRKSNPNDPFGAPDILPLNNPPPAPVQPLRPLNPSQAISSLGPPAAPYGVPPPYGVSQPGYGAPPPYYPPNSIGGRSSMGPVGGMPQNTRGSFIGGVPGVNPQGYASQQPKSSLDALDWRA